MEIEEESVLRAMDNEFEYSVDSDGIYTSLATEITIRKCKIEQRKQKAKMLIMRIKEINNELKHAEKKQMYLMKEMHVITSQRASKVGNMRKEIESRRSLEIALSDLINKVSCKRAETDEKNKMYKEAIEKSLETQESYKAVYEEFPLARKRREVTNEVKKVIIEIRQTTMDIKDFKYKENLRKTIKDKRNHIWAVNMAKAYFKIQEKVSENSLLQNKLSELNKKYEDMKAGKSTDNWMLGKQAPIEYGLKRFQEFQGVASLRSDTAAVVNQSQSGSLFNWKTPLFNYQSSSSFSEQIKKTFHEAIMYIKEPDSSNKNMIQCSTIFKPSQLQGEKGNELPLKNTKESTNVLSEVSTFVNNSFTLKRKNNIENKVPNKKNTKKLVQDAEKSVTNNQDVQDKNNFKTKVATQSVHEKSNRICLKNITDNQEEIINYNKETIKTNHDFNSSSKIKSLIMSLTVSNKAEDKTPIIIDNQKLSYEPQKNVVPPKCHAKDNSKPCVNYQPSLQQENCNKSDISDNLKNCGKHVENAPMAMDPTSPPDLVPIENNSQSQSISQKMNLSDQISSQNSEMTSSVEFDETTKVHYERVAAVSPGLVRAVGPQFKTTASEDMSKKVTSQYFSSSPQSSLNTPTTSQGDYQPMPYSPPANLLQNDSVYSTNVRSPSEANLGNYQPMPYSPPANLLHNDPVYSTNVQSPPDPNLAAFSLGKNTTTNKEGQNDGEGGFTFGFMSSSAKKSAPSIFTLF